MRFLNKFFNHKKDDHEVYLEQAKSLILKGDLDGGIKLLKRAIGLYPHITNQIYRIAYKLHAGAKSKNKAAGGNMYYSDGIAELESAIALMELLTEFKPDNADVWLQLGLLYDNHCFFAYRLPPWSFG